jgi:hypothetical protein
MLEKLLKWILGEKMASSAAGIAAGAVTGAAAVAMTGNLDKHALIIGAVGGAASALAGSTGRIAGEQR